MELHEHNQFVLTSVVTGDDGEGLKPGDVGVIIHIHPGGRSLCRRVLNPEWELIGHRHSFSLPKPVRCRTMISFTPALWRPPHSTGNSPARSELACKNKTQRAR